MLRADLEPWVEDAACRLLPPEMFYPLIFDTDTGDEIIDDGQGVGDTTEFYEAARDVCRSCPVRGECLDYALRAKERFGMWGGLTPIERLRIERKGRRDRLRERRKLEKEMGL